MNPQEQIESIIFRSELEFRTWRYRLMDPQVSAIEKFGKMVRMRGSKLMNVQASAAMEDFVSLLLYKYLRPAWEGPAPGYFVTEVLDKYREENFLVHTKKQQQSESLTTGEDAPSAFNDAQPDLYLEDRLYQED